jgi:PAS domain S-box-containing protein
VESRDELGVLTQSFNSMTLQLAETRAQAERHQEEVTHAKVYVESILANLSAGVLAFDAKQRLRSANPSAADILGLDCRPLLGLPPQQWGECDAALAPLGEEIERGFAAAGASQWQRQVERDAKGGRQVLLLRGTRLPESSETGAVVVFDDITHLLQAQRDAAWAEVARRLAHEIKNPLTPIQLSAERLEVKLAERLSRAESETLRRATQTIINQVAALKAMVDDFGDYARLPAPAPGRLDLNALVSEVLALYEGSGVPVAKRLAEGLPPVWADGAQIRQVIHNLVQNAQDALENTRTGASSPAIEVRTELDGEGVRLAVSDNGGGFPEELMARIFEPYVTTKPRGTGLGLAIVKKIIDEHHGSVAIENRPSRGASVSVLLPLAKAA